MTGAYFRIMEAVSSVLIKTELDDIDLLSRSILDYVGTQQAAKKDIRVGDVLARYVLTATPPTIYARLARLEEDGWNYCRADPRDGRVKMVKLTDRARAIYAKIDKKVAKVMEDA